MRGPQIDAGVKVKDTFPISDLLFREDLLSVEICI